MMNFRTAIFFFSLLFSVSSFAGDKIVEVGGVSYKLTNSKDYGASAILQSIVEDPLVQEITIPDTLIYKKKKYKVEWYNTIKYFFWKNTNLRKVTIGFAETTLDFSGCINLEEVIVKGKRLTNTAHFVQDRWNRNNYSLLGTRLILRGCKKIKCLHMNEFINGHDLINACIDTLYLHKPMIIDAKDEIRKYYLTDPNEKITSFNTYYAMSFHDHPGGWRNYEAKVKTLVLDYDNGPFQSIHGRYRNFMRNMEFLVVDSMHSTPVRNIENLIITDKVTTLQPGAFHNCWDLKSVNIAKTCVNIPDDAFSGCSGIEHYNKDNPRAVAVIECELGISKLEKDRDKALSLLKNARSLGSARATCVIAEYFMEGEEQLANIRLAAEKGYSGAITFMKGEALCDRIKQRMETLVVDTAGYEQDMAIFNQLVTSNFIPWCHLYSLDNMIDKLRTVKTYYNLCKTAIFDRPEYKYVVKDWGKDRGIGYGILNEEEDMELFNKAKALCDSLSSRSPFFAAAKQKLEERQNALIAKIDVTKAAMRAAWEKERAENRELRRRQAENPGYYSGGFDVLTTDAPEKSGIDAEVDVKYTSETDYETVNIFFRPNVFYKLQKTIRFEDGTKSQIHKVPDENNYYGGYGAYSTEADAAAAEYFYKKHHVERKKGKTREVSIF